MVLMALAARDDRVVAPVVVRSRPATVRGGPLHPESNGDPVRSTALPLGDGGFWCVFGFGGMFFCVELAARSVKV